MKNNELAQKIIENLALDLADGLHYKNFSDYAADVLIAYVKVLRPVEPSSKKPVMGFIDTSK